MTTRCVLAYKWINLVTARVKTMSSRAAQTVKDLPSAALITLSRIV